MKAASIVINYSLEVKPGERVHIATDTEVSPIISSCLAGAVNAAGGIPSIISCFRCQAQVQNLRCGSCGNAKGDCLINACSRSITHSRACRYAYEELGIRYVVMSNDRRHAASWRLPSDYEIVRDISLKTLKPLTKALRFTLLAPTAQMSVLTRLVGHFGLFTARLSLKRTLLQFFQVVK
jgi:hypothetical protein